jgi:DNA gyrase/topoisomerase IV subunit B
MFGENQKMDILEATPEAIGLLEDLMGINVEPRREFIFENVDFSEVRE